MVLTGYQTLVTALPLCDVNRGVRFFPQLIKVGCLVHPFSGYLFYTAQNVYDGRNVGIQRGCKMFTPREREGEGEGERGRVRESRALYNISQVTIYNIESDFRIMNLIL